ncbi:MAG: hypothetical protein WD069_05415 [Planctomycetales bacterium]
MPIDVAHAQPVGDIPVNKWVRLDSPANDGPGFSWSGPVYVPQRGQVLHWGGVAYYRGPGRNDVRVFDAVRGRWVSDYESTAADVGITGGGAGSAITYTGEGELRADGTPKPAMVVQGGTWDSKRGRLVYTLPGLMAAYDPQAKKWEELPAKTVIYGNESAGGPPLYGIGACYDPVNDEIVLFPHFHAKNIDLREATGQITGHYGTLRFSYADKTWRRVGDTFGTPEVKEARTKLIGLMSQVSPTMDAVWLLRRTPDAARTGDTSKQIESAAAAAENLALPTVAKAECADVPARLKEAVSLVRGGKLDDALIPLRDALWSMNVVLDGPLRVEPPARCAAPMVYDPKRKSIVMFGGQNSLLRTDLDDPQPRYEFSMGLDDTWVYDCGSRQWREVKSDRRPPRQRLPLMAYDPKSESIVLVTLRRGDPAKAIIWSLDLDAGEWSLRDEQEWPGAVHWVNHTQGSTPNQMMALDEKAGLLVVTQPEGNAQEQATYVLKLDLAALPAKPAPEALPAPPIEPHEVPADDPELVAKLKELPFDTWVQANPPRRPAPRDWGNLAVDPVRGWVVYFGGGHSTYQGSDVDVYVPGVNRWTTGVGRHNDYIPIVGWEGSTIGLGGEARAGHMRNQYVAFDGRLYRRAGTPQEAFPELDHVWFYDIDRGGVWREMPIAKVTKIPEDVPETHNNTQMIDPAGRILDIQLIPATRYDWRIVKCVFRSYDIDANELLIREVPVPFPNRNAESRPFCYIPDRDWIFWCEYRREERNQKGASTTWAYDIRQNKFIDLKPQRPLPGLVNVVEYIPEQKAALASIDGKFFVYSFEKNDWLPFEPKVEGGRVTVQKPYGQMVFVPKYGLFVNIPHSGTQLLRPDFARLKSE